MKTFNVLDPEIDVRKSLLLEASAGTGKTFSIENIVVRAIADDPKFGKTPLSIKDILVVTFTKAAAKELRLRILKNLQKAFHSLQKKGEDLAAIQRVRAALVEFDLANISTIHAFCYRAIVENAMEVRLNENSNNESSKIIWQAIENYFRTDLTEERFTANELNILLKPHQNDVCSLVRDVICDISRGISFVYPISSQEAFLNLQEIVEGFKKRGWTKEQLKELFEVSAENYYGLTEGRTKTLKSEYQEVIDRFLTLFDEAQAIDFEGMEEVLTLFDAKNLKKTKLDKKGELQEILDAVIPAVFTLGNYDALYARFCSYLQKAVFEAFDENEVFDFSYLLIKMRELVLTNETFKSSLQNRYQMVIIDEFQDTDPIQWSIFKQVFAKSSCPLILVGDPKQSIYAFRSADIYTYLDAVKNFSCDSKFALGTNYRSTKELIYALNHLFDSKKVPGWISLPYLKTDLPYNYVKAPEDRVDSKETALQFLLVDVKESPAMKLEEIEEKYLFPRFVSEIQYLHETKNIELSKIAFLVRDKKQSDRLFKYFREKGVFAMQRRLLSLSKTEILQDLIYLLESLVNPRQIKNIQVALGTHFFKWKLTDFKKLEDSSILSEILLHFQKWNLIWKSDGVAAGLESLLETHFLNAKQSIQEFILDSKEGLKRYHELRQLIEWMGERESVEKLSPFALIEELKSILALEHPLQDSLFLRPLIEKQAVQILTLHMSKGLEFEVVFALGVINRSPKDSGLILSRGDSEVYLRAARSNDPAKREFLEESDAEKSRQLYVALTRAKSRLYIPFINGWKPPLRGSASPLELWVARIHEDESSWDELYKRFDVPQLPQLEAHIKDCPYIKIEKLPASIFHGKGQTKVFQKLFAPDTPSLSFPKWSSVSFTSFKGGSNVLAPRELAPYDFNTIEKTIHTLPSSAYTGEFIHKILEEIPFSLIQQASKKEDLLPFIRRFSARTSFESWEEVLAEMIYKAFKTPICSKDFSLDVLSETTTFREMEFMYPLEIANKIPECKDLQGLGLVKGVIDLFFMHEGKYYLLDWKTNWLGSSEKSYSENNLKQSLFENRYDLQASIYQTALKQYLGYSGVVEGDFGGAIYCFLRGPAFYVL